MQLTLFLMIILLPVNRSNINLILCHSWSGFGEYYITNLLKQGKDLRLVQAFAGHKYPSTTELYKQTEVELLKTSYSQQYLNYKKKLNKLNANLDK